MGRLEFSKLKSLLRWAEINTAPEKHYAIHTTERDEIILQPKKSTRPVEYAYYSGRDSEKGVDELQKIGFDVFEMKRYAWKADSPVGSRVEGE